MDGQLPLDFRLRDEAMLSRFIVGPNAELLGLINGLNTASLVTQLFIYGISGMGKTHLLQALARLDKHVIYLPLRQMGQLTNNIFEGLGGRQLICLDDIDDLAGNADLELALFTLINQLRDNDASFLLTAAHKPNECGFKLKDLVSRLNACMNYRLQAPADDDKRDYLKQDARARGLELSDEVVDWILAHVPRDMGSLNRLMNRLDVESLRTQRRITIPFVKMILSS